MIDHDQFHHNNYCTQLFELDAILLKFMTLLTDNLNGIIKQVGNVIATKDAQIISTSLAVIFPGIFLVSFGLIYTPLLNVHQLRDNGEKCFGKIVNIIVSWSVFFGGISYFVGDNIVETAEQILTDDNFNSSMIMTGDTAHVLTIVKSIHPVVLILALILHDILPYEFKQEQNKDSRGKHTKSDDKERKEDTDYSLYKEMVNTTVLIIKFDSWFTIIQSAGSCASPIQLGLIWFLWFLLSFGVYSILISIKIFSYCDDHRHVGQDHFRSNLFYGLIMAIVFLIAFALSLLGDNSQPLDCYQQVSPTVKLCFLLISFLIFLSSFVNYIVYLSFTGER